MYVFSPSLRGRSHGKFETQRDRATTARTSPDYSIYRLKDNAFEMADAVLTYYREVHCTREKEDDCLGIERNYGNFYIFTTH